MLQDKTTDFTLMRFDCVGHVPEFDIMKSSYFTHPGGCPNLLINPPEWVRYRHQQQRQHQQTAGFHSLIHAVLLLLSCFVLCCYANQDCPPHCVKTYYSVHRYSNVVDRGENKFWQMQYTPQYWSQSLAVTYEHLGVEDSSRTGRTSWPLTMANYSTER